MLAFLFDTDHLTLYEHAHPLVRQRLALQSSGAIVAKRYEQ